MEIGISESLVERVGTCPECSSRLNIKLFPEEYQDFKGKLNILCEPCTWADQFYLSTVIFPKTNHLRRKRPFSINTRNIVAFREIGQGYEGLKKLGTLMNMLDS